MEYRPFGQTDLDVSVLGFGCWEMGGGYGDIETAEVAAAVNRAIDVGVNCFDTAPAYGRGQSERFLGQALGTRRKDVLVVTKCGVGYRDRPKFRDSRPDAIFASIDQSLLDLGTDYVDVLLIHWPDVTTPFEETMGALDEVVRQGKAGERRGFLERQVRRQVDEALLGERHVLREHPVHAAAERGRLVLGPHRAVEPGLSEDGRHAVALADTGHAVADLGDLACAVGARNQGQPHLARRGVAHRVQVAVVQRDGPDADLDLPWPRRRAGPLDLAQPVDVGSGLYLVRPHGLSLRPSSWRRPR